MTWTGQVRSLAPRPAVLLFDEPLTGLDRELHDRLATELAALLVTHDHDEALRPAGTSPPREVSPGTEGPCL